MSISDTPATSSAAVPTFLVRTETELAFHELPLLRGAVINQPCVNNILYHNHIGGGILRYAYPLIQYKRLDGKAAIFYIGEGTDEIAELLRQPPQSIRLGSREVAVEFSGVDARTTRVQVWDDTFAYTLRKWLPFNQGNYERYLRSGSLVERLSLMESTLVGNILSFAKGVGVHFDKRVEAKVCDCSEPHIYTHKGVKMTSFDILFQSNVSLPDHIGLGKGVSLGFGTIKKQHTKS